MPNFVEFIKREGRFFIFSRSLFALVIGFITWPSLLYLLDLYDSVSPIKESDALNWVFSVSLLSLIVFLVLLFFSWKKKPSIKTLAKQIEGANPDLLDLLNCAVELEEVSKVRSLSFMEKRVLKKTEVKAREIAWSQGTRPKPRFWMSLVFALTVGSIFTVLSLEQSPLQKSIDSLSEEPGLFIFTTKTGSSKLEEFPASNEFSRGTDISVFADVTRGHRGEKRSYIE